MRPSGLAASRLSVWCLRRPNSLTSVFVISQYICLTTGSKRIPQSNGDVSNNLQQILFVLWLLSISPAFSRTSKPRVLGPLNNVLNWLAVNIWFPSEYHSSVRCWNCGLFNKDSSFFSRSEKETWLCDRDSISKLWKFSIFVRNHSRIFSWRPKLSTKGSIASLK